MILRTAPFWGSGKIVKIENYFDMDSIISTFHIDWKLLIAQMVNFAIVFFVLHKFALKPIMKTMDERTKKVEKGIKDAKKIEERLFAADKECEGKIIKARKESSVILEQAQKKAKDNKNELVKKSKEEVAGIIQKAKEQIKCEKEKMAKELKMEMADLVILSVEKVLAKKIDSKEDRELIKKIVK